jgi:hypothetical protein
MMSNTADFSAPTREALENAAAWEAENAFALLDGRAWSRYSRITGDMDRESHGFRDFRRLVASQMLEQLRSQGVM